MDYNKEYVNSGIYFTFDNESDNLSFSKKIINIIARFLIVSGLSMAIIFEFTTAMSINVKPIIIVLAISLPALIFSILFFSIKKKMFTFLIAFFVSIGLCACFFKIIPTATKVISYACKKSIYAAMQMSFSDTAVAQNSGNILQVTAFFALCGLIISLILSLFISGKTNCFLVIALSLPVFVFVMLLGCNSSVVSVALFLCGIFASVDLHIANRQKNTSKLKDYFKKSKEKDFTYKDKNKHFGISALTVAVCVLLCFAISFGIFGNFTRSEKLKKTRIDLIAGTFNAYDLITGEDHDASMKDGLLYKYGDRRVKKRHYFTLTTKDVNTNLYFKGFTGSVYTGFSWKKFDDYSGVDEFNGYLYRKKMSLATLTGDMLAKDKKTKDLEKTKFTLSDFRRNKPFMYVLNGSVSNGKIVSYDDATAFNDGLDEYSYKAYYNPASYASIPYTSLYSDAEFRQEWTSYCKFVNSNYTLLPEGIDDVARLSKELSANNVYELVDVVRDFLAKNTTYSDKVNKLPEDKDFVSYFIYETGKGYSPHYATAAAVILRSFGVPTRYCEGFLVPSGQISETKEKNGKKQVEIIDGNAHAWIEIFDANYGWVPVEVTPGYYQEAFAQTVENERNEAKKPKKKPKKKKVEHKEKAEQKSSQIKKSAVKNKDINTTPKQKKKAFKTKKPKTDYFKRLIAPISVLSVILIFVLIMLIRRRKKLAKRKALFNSTNYKKQVIAAFGIIIDMMKFIGVPIEDAYEYDDFKVALKKCYVGKVEDERLDNVLTVYERALFSKQPINADDADEVLDFLDDFGYGIYVTQRLKNKIRLKYLKVLI